MWSQELKCVKELKWKRTKVLLGCPWSLLTFAARDGAPLECVPSHAQPGDRDHPFQLRLLCESVPGWEGEFAGNLCSLEMLCPHVTVREQRVCLAVQLGISLLCR